MNNREAAYKHFMQEEMRIGKLYQDIFNAGYQAALASQAQQPDYKLNELAQIIMSDCGISTTNNDQLYDRILGRLIASSELQSQAQQPAEVKQLRDKVFDLQGENLDMYHRILHLEGVLSANNESQSQQESQWISVDEYDPINGELVYVFHKTVREVAIAVCETSKHYSRFTSNKFGSEPTSYYTHVSRMNAPLPPAPEGGDK